MIYVFLIGGITRRDRRLAAARLPVPGHLLRRRAPAQRAHRRHGLRHASRGSTSGSPRSPAGCWTSAWARSTSGCWVVGVDGHVPAAVPAGRGGHAAALSPTTRRNPGWGDLNLISTLGSLILAVGVLPSSWSPWCWRCAERRDATDDPWEGNSLEWATSSPPPHHNFRSAAADPPRAARVRRAVSGRLPARRQQPVTGAWARARGEAGGDA